MDDLRTPPVHGEDGCRCLKCCQSYFERIPGSAWSNLPPPNENPFFQLRRPPGGQ